MCTFAKYILCFRVQRHLVYIHSYTGLCYVSHSLPSFALTITTSSTGLPMCLSAKESACQCSRCKRLRLDPWVEKIPWRRKRQPNPVFLPGNFPWTEKEVWRATVHGVAESDTTVWLWEHTHLLGQFTLHHVIWSNCSISPIVHPPHFS